MRTFSTSERLKVARPPQFFALLTWKCASRHNGVHFFNLSTSKSALSVVRFFTLLTSTCASRHRSIHFFHIKTSKSVPNPAVFDTFDLEMRFAPQRRPLFHFQKSAERGAFVTLLTSTCASRHSGVHFLHIKTSKSVSNPAVFYTFDLEMCFAPQRRALFRHLNFQKWSETAIF